MHKLRRSFSLLLLFLIVAEKRCLADDELVVRPDAGLSDQLRQVMTYYDAKFSKMAKRISLLESKLSKCGGNEEKRQVSSTSLNGALQTILKHFKHQGEIVEVPETQRYDNNTAAAAVAAKIGSVYTRWGRTVCDSDSALIYSGFAAGTYYSTTGGGANYQCMPLDPEYNEYVPGGNNAVLSGAEYETSGSIFNSVHEHNVPCARCYTSNSATMMIPGKRTCPPSWKEEFQGYLMTEYGHHRRSTFECVDSEPESIVGSAAANTNGALFYFVKADCDGEGTTGHCPPYDSDKPITCVVCSK